MSGEWKRLWIYPKCDVSTPRGRYLRQQSRKRFEARPDAFKNEDKIDHYQIGYLCGFRFIVVEEISE